MNKIPPYKTFLVLADLFQQFPTGTLRACVGDDRDIDVLFMSLPAENILPSKPHFYIRHLDKGAGAFGEDIPILVPFDYTSYPKNIEWKFFTGDNVEITFEMKTIAVANCCDMYPTEVKLK